MIFEKFPATKPKAWSVPANVLPPHAVPKQTQQNWGSPPGTAMYEPRPNFNDKQRALQFGIDPMEFVRRDKIVRQMWIDCGYKAGEVVRPKSDEAYEKYGRITIRGIYKSYHDFHTAEAKDWPDDDLPFIMSGSPDKKPDNVSSLIMLPSWVCRFYPNV